MIIICQLVMHINTNKNLFKLEEVVKTVCFTDRCEVGNKIFITKKQTDLEFLFHM